MRLPGVLALLLAALLTPAVTAGRLAEAVGLAHADAVRLSLSGLEEHDLQAYRYFWVSTPEGKQRESFRAAFRLHLNLLSRYSEMVDVVEVAPDLWRVDIDEMKWDRATLEAARFVDPFFHEKRVLKEETTFAIYWPGGVNSLDGESSKKARYKEVVKVGEVAYLSASWLPVKDITELRKILFTEVPVLNAEWLLVQSARQLSLRNKQEGLGYYDFLQLKDRDAYFQLLRFNEKDSIAVHKEIRSVQEISGVSPTPRQLVRFQAVTGATWVALDTNDPEKGGIALNNLERGKFVHQIEEWYGFLPNGLTATFLSDQNGNRANNAPADAAGFRDDSRLNEGKDGRIHVNLACLRCHAGQVLLPIDDHVRKIFKSPLALGIEDKKRLLDLRRQYFSNLEKALKRDREDYQEAFSLATVTVANPKGLTAQKAVETYARAFHSYADDVVTIEKAARELGVSLDDWKAALEWQWKGVKKLDLRLAPFVADPPLPITRVTWEDGYLVAQDTLANWLAQTGGKKP